MVSVGERRRAVSPDVAVIVSCKFIVEERGVPLLSPSSRSSRSHEN
jgi:hypothetical protein